MRLTDFINEASVSGGQEENAAIRVADYIGKKLGTKFMYVNCEGYSNAEGTFVGFFFASPDDSALRINWNDDTFIGLSYWRSWVDTPNKPTMEIRVSNIDKIDSSFAVLLPRIVDAIQNGEVAEDLEEAYLQEKAITFEGNSWNSPAAFIKDVASDWSIDQIQSVLKQNGNTYNKQQIQQKVNQVLGVEDKPEESPTKKNLKKAPEITVMPGKPEKTITPPSVDKANKLLAKTKYSDPETIFEDLDSYTQMVATGYNTALLITGQGGVGKSYNVTQVLNKFGTKGEDWVIMKGKCTPIKMYNFLYKHYNQICVFDDCDSVFDSKDGINILKGVLDSGENREVSWDNANTVDTYGMSHEEIETTLATAVAAGQRNAIPNYFEFEGAVIFISNLTYDDIYKKDRALPTRCITIDITLKAEDIINRIKTVLPNIKIYKALKKRGAPEDSKDITNEELKKEVFDFMTSDEYRKDPRFGDKEINFRTFNKIYMLRAANLPNWKRLAFAC